MGGTDSNVFLKIITKRVKMTYFCVYFVTIPFHQLNHVNDSLLRNYNSRLNVYDH